jgi:methyl-CpG-binding domain protein 4
MNWKPPKSPHTLLQEQLWQDPWKIFVCCIFCNLTKRMTAEPYFWEVLKRWPTPKKLADADYDKLVKLIQDWKVWF